MYEFIKNGDIDLIVCDIVLPTDDGYSLFEKLAEFPQLGKIFISGKIELEHRVKGLALGADDYICKPLDSTELLLRSEALLKRISNSTHAIESNSSNIRFLDLSLNIETRVLSGHNKSIDIGLVEHELLILLIALQGKICNREKIYSTLGDSEKRFNCLLVPSGYVIQISFGCAFTVSPPAILI